MRRGVKPNLMRCEKCQQRQATVHLKQKGRGATADAQWEEQHLCEECFRRSPECNPGFQPFSMDERCSGDLFHFSYAWGPGHRAATASVVSISPDHMVLRVVASETGSGSEGWIFVLARLPGRWRKWPVGKQVQLSLTKAAFEYLQGKRDTYDGPGVNSKGWSR